MRNRIPLNRGIFLLPNLFTTGGLFCGFLSVIYSLDGQFIQAAWAIVMAGVFDMIDGRLARFTMTESDFGVEYDSLADLLSFGVAPAVLSYAWSLHSFNKVGWLVSFVYVAGAALRLARYNVQIFSIEKKHFEGLPSPSAALLVCGMVLITKALALKGIPKTFIPMAITGVAGLLMVSSVRYRSFKDLDLKNRSSFYTLVGAVILIIIFAFAPDIMVFAIFGVYALTGLVEELIFFGKRRDDREYRRQQQREMMDQKIEERRLRLAAHKNERSQGF